MPPACKLVENVQKIAVLRAGGIGDFIFTLPAMGALREVYSEAEITLLGTGWHEELLSGRPGPIDRTIAIPPSTGVNGPDTGVDEDQEELERFFKSMREERFDLALQMHGGGGYSNLFISRLEARVAAGPKTPDAVALDRSIPYVYYQSEIMRNLETVSLVGARTADLEPRLKVMKRDLAEAGSVLPESGTPLVALHPGAGDERRQWPPEKFATVGDALARAGVRVAVVGAEEDRALVSRIAETMNREALNLCGQLSLGGLTGLLSRCAVIVSNDSGPLHVAVAVGAATVGIYWGPNFINAGPPMRNKHRPVLSWRSNCPVCGETLFNGTCGHKASIVSDIPTDEVADYALELLASEFTASDRGGG